jgi:predicted nucleic acid-binding protein
LNGILLDTSFLITFANPARPQHAVARSYFRECLKRQIPIYLSTIAISEFQVKQSISDLPLRNLIVLPFNVDHARSCGHLIRQISRDAGDDRVRVKDDFKLIAQCACEGISHILSEDKSTLLKYIDKANEADQFKIKSILLINGFDTSWFDNGQHSFYSEA